MSGCLRQTERVSRPIEERVDALEATLADVAGAVQEVSDFLGIPKGESSSPWWWPSLDRDQARNAWRLLVPFVEMLGQRYHQGHPIRACWYAHPEVLDELSALYYEWKRSYTPNVDRTAPWYFVQNVKTGMENIRTNLGGCANSSAGCQRLKVKVSELTEQDRKDYIKADIEKRDQPQTTGSTSSPASQQSAT